MKSIIKSKHKKVVSKKASSVKTLPAKKKSSPNSGDSLDVKKTSVSIKKDTSGESQFTVVAIGASAGGLEAVKQLLKHLSPTTGMAFIYVQHLSPDHKSLLTSILSKETQMVVQEIDDMEKMKPNNVYVIPYNKEIEVTDGHIKLIPRSKDKTFNLSIDVLFSSLAEARKENVVGIILSGSATDGTRGLKEIKQAGGITFAQDDTAKFTSMPHSAVDAGIVDFVLSPKEIATKLNWMSKHQLSKRNQIRIAPEDKVENSNPELNAILQLIFKLKKVDFSHYKMSTIKRRMLRRMLIHKIKSLKQYIALLEKDTKELDVLYQDLLINVTEFFRDSATFLYLKKTILPRLLKTKSKNETIRIWVAGCSTGEEVYSLAMLLYELQASMNLKIPFQVFASDLSAQAITIARNGEYSTQQLNNVSPKRLQQFFFKSNDKYRISKALRDVCVFAQHNVLSDPPFSKMDLISCRNLLIYLDNPAQKKAIATFHYALKENGYLLLGKSETIGTSGELFTVLSKQHKIYISKKVSGAIRIPSLKPLVSRKIIPEVDNPQIIPSQKPATNIQSNITSAFDAAIIANHVPASVLINYDLEIIQFRGATEMYLKHTAGKASLNILRMALPEIAFELRNAIHHAIKTKKSTYKKGIELSPSKNATSIRIIDLEVSSLKLTGEDPLLMVVFTERQMELAPPHSGGKMSNTSVKDRRIKKLEQELAAARSDMGSITHDQESVNDELQVANEEVVSSNEELQSLNEELETSKEEIESANEELTTSNQELLARNQEVEKLYTYYEAILSTIQEPMLILDEGIKIKSANKSFYSTFHVTESASVGQSLYKIGNNQWNIPRLRLLLEDILPKKSIITNFEVEHDFPVIGQKSMLLNAHRILNLGNNEELIVLTILDITEVRKLNNELLAKEKLILERQLESEKEALSLIEASNKRYNMMLMQSPFAFAILKGKDHIITLANDSLKTIWGKGDRIEGKPLLTVLPELKKNGSIPKLLSRVYKSGIAYHGYEELIPLMRNGILENMYFNFVYQPYKEVDETISGVTVIAQDVTSQVTTKEALKEAKIVAETKTRIAETAMASKQQFLSNMSHEIRTPMNAIIGFTNALLKSDLTSKQKEHLSAIKTSGDSLIILINDILDLAKVDSGKMAFEKKPFSLKSSINSIVELFQSKIEEKNLEFEKECDLKLPPVVIGDQMHLRQIISNLISNALKFTSKGKISLKVRLLKEDSNSVTVEFIVSDTGIGIEKENLAKIFEIFQQATIGTARQYGGTGLGLAIVKQLVENQGGKIRVDSTVNKGSSFSFTLDFQKTNETLIPETQSLTMYPEISSIKVLVAEDVPLNQLLIKTLLDDFGFETDIAENGKITIEKMLTKSFDIVLMDLHMPEMDGFETTEYIRHKLNSAIPIIALTADVTTVDLAKCKTAGMNDYISKPIDENLLYQKIIALVSNGSQDKSGNKTDMTSASKEKLKHIDLTYLFQRTKSNPKLMREIISIYLKQTPTIISAMNKHLFKQDWDSLYKAAHKLIPSFAIMGMSKDYENISRSIEEYARTAEFTDRIPDLLKKLELFLEVTYQELNEELKKFEL